MDTLTESVERHRYPLVVRWELVTDASGRTRPEMRWVADAEAAAERADATLAA